MRIFILVALGLTCCTDAGSSVEADATVIPDVDAQTVHLACDLEQPNVAISGMTPTGPIDHMYGYFSYDGKCGTYMIATYPTSAITDESVPLLFSFRNEDQPATLPAGFTINDTLVDGEVDVSKESIDHLSGSFSVQKPGWDLTGTFEIDGQCVDPPFWFCI